MLQHNSRIVTTIEQAIITTTLRRLLAATSYNQEIFTFNLSLSSDNPKERCNKKAIKDASRQWKNRLFRVALADLYNKFGYHCGRLPDGIFNG